MQFRLLGLHRVGPLAVGDPLLDIEELPRPHQSHQLFDVVGK